MGEHKLRVSLPGCGVLFEQKPEPNDHQGTVAITPQQVCDIDIDHYKGPVNVTGFLDFDKKTKNIKVSLHGIAPPGPTHVDWNLNYDGNFKPK
jgi:hypothetical protein